MVLCAVSRCAVTTRLSRCVRSATISATTGIWTQHVSRPGSLTFLIIQLQCFSLFSWVFGVSLQLSIFGIPYLNLNELNPFRIISFSICMSGDYDMSIGFMCEVTVNNELQFKLIGGEASKTDIQLKINILSQFSCNEVTWSGDSVYKWHPKS